MKRTPSGRSTHRCQGRLSTKAGRAKTTAYPKWKKSPVQPVMYNLKKKLDPETLYREDIRGKRKV